MTPWVRNLLLANIVMFFLSQSLPAVGALVLIPAQILERPWTVVTYMFLHAGLSHLLFNMLGLYFFGSRLELLLGARRFLTLYFISGLSAALVSVIFTPHAPIVGASGAIFGIMLGYARYWPRDIVYIWGVFPVQARWLVAGMTVLELLGSRNPTSNIAHFAHLGGFLGGLLYLWWTDRHSPARQFRAQATAPARPRGSADIERWKSLRPDGLHPLNQQELERLQQQIAAGDAASLTPDERAFLDRLSEAEQASRRVDG